MRDWAKCIKMGTRFVTTNECDASVEYKQNYISCSSNDITIIDNPVGLPGRVITNNFVQEIQAGKIGHTGSDPGVYNIMIFDSKTNTDKIFMSNENLVNANLDEFKKIWNGIIFANIVSDIMRVLASNPTTSLCCNTANSSLTRTN